jgi:ADP-ribose pyrophosphatase
MKVNLLNTRVEFDGFLRIEKDTFQFESFRGGMSGETVRFRYTRGDAVAVLIYDSTRGCVLLIRQFRNAVHAATGSGWMLECVAGMMEKGETPAEVAFREVTEETGLILRRVEPLTTYFFSPGGCSDRVHLFQGTVEDTEKPLGIHGLAEEGEEVLAEWIALEQALQWVDEGKIIDGKTIIGLMMLSRRLNRPASS